MCYSIFTMNQEQKAETERQMRAYDRNFKAYGFAYNKRDGVYGEITMQNLAGMYVKYKPKGDCDMYFRTHWGYHEVELFDDEKDMLVHKLKNEK